MAIASEAASSVPLSPYMPMFQTFRAELDDHHDRRERVVKASRDVTALSKKIIFSLQRALALSTPLPAHIVSENKPRKEQIATLLTTLLESDLAGSFKVWRYQRQISPGLQELVEAAVFEHYLVHQRLPSLEELRAASPAGVLLMEEDWLLGVFDAVGEMMRWAITNVALRGTVPGGTDGFGKGLEGEVEGGDVNAAASGREVGATSGGRNMLVDMRQLRACLEGLETQGAAMHNGVGKKMDVMRQCVEKVENAVYGMVVRGKERPTGWVPEGRDEGRVEAVESY